MEKQFFVIYASEKNLFEIKKESFNTIESATQFLTSLSNDSGLEIENITIEGIDCETIGGVDYEWYVFYAYLTDSINIVNKIENFFKESRKNYIGDNF